MTEINRASLKKALEAMFSTEIRDASCEAAPLQGGTVGDVIRLEGEARTSGGPLPFRMVLKNQRQWERPGDPGSWRREYEIYRHGLAEEFPGGVRLPQCYLLEEEEGLTRIWMEFVEGRSGEEELKSGELARTARHLGRFQAEYRRRGRMDLPYIRSFPAVRSSFAYWHGQMREALSQPMEGFPEELRQCLNDYGARAKGLLRSFEILPRTLCQGDVHHDNLIFRREGQDEAIYLLDWDTAGYGYMGEDAVDVLAEAFVYPDRDVAEMPAYRGAIIDGYCQGAREAGVSLPLCDGMVRDLFALAWGFRIAEHFHCYYREDAKTRRRLIAVLEAMLL